MNKVIALLRRYAPAIIAFIQSRRSNKRRTY